MKKVNLCSIMSTGDKWDTRKLEISVPDDLFDDVARRLKVIEKMMALRVVPNNLVSLGENRHHWASFLACPNFYPVGVRGQNELKIELKNGWVNAFANDVMHASGFFMTDMESQGFLSEQRQNAIVELNHILAGGGITSLGRMDRYSVACGLQPVSKGNIAVFAPPRRLFLDDITDELRVWLTTHHLEKLYKATLKEKRPKWLVDAWVWKNKTK